MFENNYQFKIIGNNEPYIIKYSGINFSCFSNN